MEKLGSTPQQYGRNVLNLVNSRNPEERAAVAIQVPQHPVRHFIQPVFKFNVEEELGLDTLDEPVFGPPEKEEEETPELYNKVSVNSLLICFSELL